MRHRKTVKKLNRTVAHRKALLANLAAALFEHKRIVTTHAKAKAAQQYIEKLITLAKANTVHSRRLALQRVRHKWVVQTLFNEIAPVYLQRNGGYTRVIRMGRRHGDAAEVSVLELVDFEEAIDKTTKEKQEKQEAKEKTKVEKQKKMEKIEAEETVAEVKEEEKK